MRIRLTAALSLMILMYAPAVAHHGTATDFDTTRLTLLHGIITKIEWINPHAWLYLRVKASDGMVTNWQIEGGSPEALALRNFPKDSVVPGMEISMTVYPAKNGEFLADGGTITFSDGKRIFFGGSAPVDGLDKDGKPCVIRRSSRQPAVDCRR